MNYCEEVTTSSKSLTVGEAAGRLGLTYRDVYRLIDEGKLPAVRAEGGLVVAVADVDALASRP